MSRRAFVVVAFVAGASGSALAPAASAQQAIYSCKDRGGRTITSDHPADECIGVIRELGPSGIVRREIPPPLTIDQQHRKDLDDKARRTAEEAAREKRRRDSALLAAYQSEDQIEAARRRSLADADESIRVSRTRLDELAKERKALVQDSEAAKGKNMSPLFQRKIDDNQALIDDEEASMKMRLSDVERVNQRYDEDVRRYRELIMKPAAK